MNDQQKPEVLDAGEPCPAFNCTNGLRIAGPFCTECINRRERELLIEYPYEELPHRLRRRCEYLLNGPDGDQARIDREAFN